MAGERSNVNPQQGGHPRMGAGLPARPGGSRPENQGATGTIEKAGERVADVAGQVRDKAQDLASGVAQRAEDAWDSTRQGVRQGASAVAGTTQDFFTSATDLIRRYPVTAVAVAFSLGCLTTMCLQATCDFGTDDVADRMSRASA